ncbi:MAG: hypothetical protein ABEJ75_02585 [Candidatus Nanohaloarchaea archaeon]
MADEQAGSAELISLRKEAEFIHDEVEDTEKHIGIPGESSEIDTSRLRDLYRNNYLPLRENLRDVINDEMLPKKLELDYSFDFASRMHGEISNNPESARKEMMKEMDRTISIIESKIDESNNSEKEDEISDIGIQRIKRVCQRVHSVARELDTRHNDRPPVRIEDEYDLQYLFAGLLRLDFDDIRPEDYGPKHGGSPSRIDFLLKREEVGIELKYGENKTKRELKKEISEDKEHYKSLPNCNHLIFFIYDTNLGINNPRGFEDDLSDNSEEMSTEVLIRPKGS